MNKREMQDMKKYLEIYSSGLKNRLNERMFYDGDCFSSLSGEIMWIDDIALEEFEYRPKRKKYLLKGICFNIKVFFLRIGKWIKSDHI